MKIEIKTSEYYAHSEYYRFMPRCIFDALESAFLEGREYAMVDAEAFERMVGDMKG